MKLVVRADDFGFTKTLNDGLLKAVNDGIVTTIDYMLDTPGMEDGAERIKDYPWVSMGWHTHFYWKPVMDSQKVKSLLNTQTGRFRTDLKTAKDVDFDEALNECRAQVEKCIRLTGRAPDTTDMNLENLGPFELARRDICDEYGIAYGFAEKHFKQPHIAANAGEKLEEIGVSGPLEKYKSLDIFHPTDLNSLYYVHQDSAAEFLAHYDPVQYYIDDPDGLKDHKIGVQPWHPGYTDEFVREIYDNPLLNSARTVDISALCSDRVKSWIKENKVELINFRDALHGTHEYQNHLKAVGSDLAIR